MYQLDDLGLARASVQIVFSSVKRRSIQKLQQAFNFFLMQMQQTKQKFYMTNLCFDFFGTILVMPVCDCDCDDSKFKRRWRPIKY